MLINLVIIELLGSKIKIYRTPRIQKVVLVTSLHYLSLLIIKIIVNLYILTKLNLESKVLSSVALFRMVVRL